MRRIYLVGVFVSVCFFSGELVAQGQLQNFGQPIATTVQLPTFGVSFDAEGVLQLKTFTDPTGRLKAERIAAAQAAREKFGRPAVMRKVSLVRLENEIEALQAAGRKPTDAMLHVAGLTRVTSIFCFPDEGDIVIAGPAEPWAMDLAGRSVGIRSGKPVLQLADLAVALRAYQPETPKGVFVGCTINPRTEGLAKLQAFQKRIPKVVSQRRQTQVANWVADGVRESLGMADVKVFGVSPKTHFARVMIEADYRMKGIAIGVEPPPVRMTTFASALTTARHGALERWWLTPDYEGVAASPDRLAMKLSGQGVQLQTELKDVLADGTIVDVGRKPTRATRAYASSFTKQYQNIADVSPVYAQLRQLTDLLIVASFMKEHEWYRKAAWTAETIMDEEKLSTQILNNPVSASVVVNAFWKGHRMFSPAGGGVSIRAEEALSYIEPDKDLDDERKVHRAPEKAAWWWD